MCILMTSTNIKMTSAHMRRDQREEMEPSMKESSCSNTIWRHTVIRFVGRHPSCQFILSHSRKSQNSGWLTDRIVISMIKWRQHKPSISRDGLPSHPAALWVFCKVLRVKPSREGSMFPSVKPQNHPLATAVSTHMLHLEGRSRARRRWLHTCMCVFACITSLSKPRKWACVEKPFLKSHEETSVSNICMQMRLKMAERTTANVCMRVCRVSLHVCVCVHASNFRVILYGHVIILLGINVFLQFDVYMGFSVSTQEK